MPRTLVGLLVTASTAAACASVAAACHEERPIAEPRTADADAAVCAVMRSAAHGPALTVSALRALHPGAGSYLVDGYVIGDPGYRCAPCPPHVACAPCPATPLFLVDAPGACATTSTGLPMASVAFARPQEMGNGLDAGDRYHLVVHFQDSHLVIDFFTDLGFGAAGPSLPCESCGAPGTDIAWGLTPGLAITTTYQVGLCRRATRAIHGQAHATPDCTGKLSCDPGTLTLADLDGVVGDPDVLLALGRAAREPGIVFGRDVRGADTSILSLRVGNATVLVGADCGAVPDCIAVPPGLRSAEVMLRGRSPRIAGCP